MLESGTKTLSLPSELYGCPYPPNPALPPGTCAAPDLCNCNSGICFGTCKGRSCCVPYSFGPTCTVPTLLLEMLAFLMGLLRAAGYRLRQTWAGQ